MATPEEIRRARENTAFGGLLGDFFAKNRAYRNRLAQQGRRPVLGGLMSKEPVMGTDTLRYEGFRPLVGNLLEPVIKGADTVRASKAGLIPKQDMLGEAFGAAGAAMLGGGFAPKPSGSLGANTLRVYHGTDADISRLDPNYGVTARDLYTTPVRSDAAEYGKNVLEFDVEGKIGNFLPEDRGISETRMLQAAYSDYGLDDYFDSFDDFVEAFDSGDMYQRFGSSAAQDEVVGALIDVGGFDAIRIPDAGFGGNMSESVVAQNPNVFKPVMANASKSAGLLSVASDVSARGDQILNMLKSGRGSEVTDAMLDMGDSVKNTQLNQYLAANYDLPLDEASRLQRQREMFPELGYHGTVTSNDFTSFRGDRETYIAPRSDEGLELVAQFSSADQGRVLPVVSTGNILDTASSEGMFQPRRDMQNIYDKQGLGEFRTGDKGLPSWADTTAINAARDAGYGGIRLDERDWVNSTAVYEPQNIRSQFARFDPRLAHLSNLTAANASKPVGLLVLEQQARGNNRLGGLLESQGMDISDLSTASPAKIQSALDTAVKRGILDPRSAAGLKRGILDGL